jgi:hypothetical protein
MATKRKLRNPISTVSDELVKLLSFDIGLDDLVPGKVPDDVIAWIWLGTDDRRRLYEAALPAVTARCNRQGFDPPTLAPAPQSRDSRCSHMTGACVRSTRRQVKIANRIELSEF